MLRWLSNGTKSRKAATLTWWTLSVSGALLGSVGSGAGSDAGSGATAGAGGGVSSGILTGSRGATDSGAGTTISTLGSGKGPIGSPSSPVSPSGTEDGAATGSEKTGSTLVVLVISSIAFCRSLSTD